MVEPGRESVAGLAGTVKANASPLGLAGVDGPSNRGATLEVAIGTSDVKSAPNRRG